jgi:hypothetical protein
MTTIKALTVLKEICSLTAPNISEALPLHQHVAALYLFETDRVVVQLNHDSDDRARARTVVDLTRWLTGQGFSSVAPVADMEQPIDIDDYTITFIAL